MSPAPSVSDRRSWLTSPSRSAWWDRQPVYGLPIPEGTRNHQLARIAGAVRGRAASYDEVFAYLLRVNQARCVPPLGDGEVRAIARSICRYREVGRDAPSQVQTRRHAHEVFPDPELVPERIRLILIRRLGEFYASHPRSATPNTSTTEARG